MHIRPPTQPRGAQRCAAPKLLARPPALLRCSRLEGATRLVGPTISCEGSPLGGNGSAEWRVNPHVQSYALAMDRVALQVPA
jgi:hypothetical protein